ncbi:MAG: DUF4330 domain-containing protein [Vampirovibrionales bacterium]|nr:DUF4330 domain-containing protein [Vampirovibrionales bacterium]
MARLKFNIIDALTFGVLVMAAVGVLAVQSGWHQTASKQIEGQADVIYTVVLPALRIEKPESVLKTGDTAHLSVRNQPRGDIHIKAVSFKPRQFVLPKGNGGYTLIEDPNLANAVDVTLTLQDHAQTTPDGVVANGVKIKIGMPIDVETPLLRAAGVITSVEVLPQR